MNDFDVKASLQEALAGVKDPLPEEIAADWEAMECLGHSERGETLLLRSRKNDGKAILKLMQGENDEMGPAEKLRMLTHPGLPKVMRVWKDGERLCILREYIEGKTLADIDGTFSPAKATEIILQLSDILTYLHGQTPPLIHRDVKPQNILLRGDGTVALIDFGIARFYNRHGEKDTRVMGTEHFAPPEQYGFRQTDCRSDLYALGMVLGWMLTGSVLQEEYEGIDDRRLKRIVKKCTAFSPEDRFSSAAEVKKALIRPRILPRTLLLIAAVPVCLLLLGRMTFLRQGGTRPISFMEPVIEQAVRKMLGVDSETALSREQLEKIEGLYVFGDVIAMNEDEFYEAANCWYAGGSRSHGTITRLEDVALLPNLRRVMIAANEVEVIAPLSALTQLEKVEFKHNRISDITPLKGLKRLHSVGLNDNPVIDVTALLTLPELRYLDLCDASAYNAVGLEGLHDMELLDISNRTDSGRYLGTKRIRDLRMGWTNLDSLDTLIGVTGLERLSIEHTRVTSLEGIERHTGLTYLRMSGCEVKDLTPLKRLPELKILVIDAVRRGDVEALGEVLFEVQYE